MEDWLSSKEQVEIQMAALVGSNQDEVASLLQDENVSPRVKEAIRLLNCMITVLHAELIAVNGRVYKHFEDSHGL